jgi:hypothetical protein
MFFLSKAVCTLLLPEKRWPQVATINFFLLDFFVLLLYNNNNNNRLYILDYKLAELYVCINLYFICPANNKDQNQQMKQKIIVSLNRKEFIKYFL